jgi:hypothetical protein
MEEYDPTRPNLNDEQRVVTKSPAMLVWSCPACGSFVAASPNPKIVAIAAAQHHCSAVLNLH